MSCTRANPLKLFLPIKPAVVAERSKSSLISLQGSTKFLAGFREALLCCWVVDLLLLHLVIRQINEREIHFKYLFDVYTLVVLRRMRVIMFYKH